MEVFHPINDNKESIAPLVVGFVTTQYIRSQSKAIAPPPVHATMRPRIIPVTDVFTAEELSDLQKVWCDDAPEGKFLRARHGTTHYKVDRGSVAPQKGMVVCAHGLGTSMKAFRDTADALVREGHAVLRYDAFGHGYSKYEGEDTWFKYTPDMFVDQLEDLLDHVRDKETEEAAAFVGHSNGGVVGISANFRWGSEGSARRVIPRMVLVNPAIYAKKPLLARIADAIPSVLIGLFRLVPPARRLVGDSYMEAQEIVFGRDPATGKYLYPEAYRKCKETNLRLFGRVAGVKEHPFLSAAIVGVSSYHIPAGLLPVHRERLSTVLLRRGDRSTETLFLWGDLDVTVPYEENIGVLRRMEAENDRLTIKVLHGLSHDCFLEDNLALSDAITSFLD